MTAAPDSKRSAARLLVEQLQTHGVERIFCVPGESYLAVLDALVDAPEIQLVTCRHEGAATMMADAYGRLTGRPGIAFVTRGPGATNAAAGVLVAYQDSTPLILFIGDVERATTKREGFQEIDFETMFQPFSKFAAQITDGQRIPEFVGRAFYTATAGRPGPVVLTLPEDMLHEAVEPRPVRPYHPVIATPARETVEIIDRHLAQAARPVIILGGGGWNAQAATTLQNYAEARNVPVITSFRCMDYIDNESRAYIGNLGLGTNPALLRAVREADLILLLGGRLSEISSNGFKLLDLPAPAQTMIHIHADPQELGRIYQPALAVNASAAATANALAALPPAGPPADPQRLAALRDNYLAWTTPGPVYGDVQMGEIMLWLRDRLPPDAILTNGAGNFAIWPNRFHRYRGYGTQLAPRSGSMGYGVPAAIAAKMTHPDRLVVCFAGDGDFMMTGAELATAMMQGVAVIVILLNNGMYGTIRMHQEREYPTRVSATTLQNPDFVQLAQAFGAHAERVTKTAAFAMAFERAVASNRAAVIELVIPPELISPSETITSLRAKAKARPA